MNPSKLTMLISYAAILISEKITDDGQLAIWGTAFIRLGNTLTAISTQRILMKKASEKRGNEKLAPKPENDGSASRKDDPRA
jgi:hypothetical protein